MGDFVIEEELKKLPARPGMYIMHGMHDEILYVGKAVNLKNRVRQYFRKGAARTPKIGRMLTLIDHFEYIVTDSELEALVLESNLIKENRPKYNTMLMDDKSYPYIRVTVGEEFPRVQIARGQKKDGARYFGPYTNATAVRDTVELLRKLCKIRACSKRLPEDIGKDRPCLYYHIGQCAAPCQGYINKEVGGYLIPDLKLSEDDTEPVGNSFLEEITRPPEPEPDLGRYGRMRRAYLEENDPIGTTEMLLMDEFFPHLMEIDRAANERVGLIMEQLLLPKLADEKGSIDPARLDDLLPWSDKLPAQCHKPRR